GWGQAQWFATATINSVEDLELVAVNVNRVCPPSTFVDETPDFRGANLAGAVDSGIFRRGGWRPGVEGPCLQSGVDSEVKGGDQPLPAPAALKPPITGCPRL